MPGDSNFALVPSDTGLAPSLAYALCSCILLLSILQEKKKTNKQANSYKIQKAAKIIRIKAAVSIANCQGWAVIRSTSGKKTKPQSLRFRVKEGVAEVHLVPYFGNVYGTVKQNTDLSCYDYF